MINLPQANSKYASEVIQMYKELISEQIDMKEFVYLMCLKTLEVSNTLSYRSIPSIPSEVVQLNAMLASNDKMKLVEKMEARDKVMRKPHIVKAIQDRSGSINSNRSNVLFLKHICRICREHGDEQSFMKAIRVLESYPKVYRPAMDDERGEVKTYRVN